MQYGSNENFNLKMHRLPALAFLPADGIPGAFNELKPQLTKEANKVTNWLGNNYVHGKIRKTLTQWCCCSITSIVYTKSVVCI